MIRSLLLKSKYKPPYGTNSSSIRNVSSTSAKASDLYSQTRTRSPIETEIPLPNTRFWSVSNSSATSNGPGLHIRDSSWSSPNDAISRNAFTKDHVRLWTMLETYIDSNDFKRAESILVALNDVASKVDIVLATNNFLLQLVESSEPNFDARADYSMIAKSWLDRITQIVTNFQSNSVTQAILLKNIYKNSHPDTRTNEIKQFLRLYKLGHAHYSNCVKELLSHVEVLGLDTLRFLVEVGCCTVAVGAFFLEPYANLCYLAL